MSSTSSRWLQRKRSKQPHDFLKTIGGFSDEDLAKPTLRLNHVTIYPTEDGATGWTPG